SGVTPTHAPRGGAQQLAVVAVGAPRQEGLEHLSRFAVPNFVEQKLGQLASLADARHQVIGSPREASPLFALHELCRVPMKHMDVWVACNELTHPERGLVEALLREQLGQALALRHPRLSLGSGE